MMIAAFQGVCFTCGHDHDSFNLTMPEPQVSSWGVWVEGEGIIYTAPCKTMCNDHINSWLMDDDLKEYAKGMRLVEIFYAEPK
jgi:hypothetical protein